jgi:membrane protein YdbS with pleckstrin-like domain
MDIQLQELIDLLSTIHLFDSLSEDQLLVVADHISTQLFRENEVIFREGSKADGLYIIASGRVEILRGDPEKGREISTFQRGDFFGEEGLQQGQERKVSAAAKTNLVLYHLRTGQISALIKEFPAIEAPIRLTLESYALVIKYRFNWRGPRESIQFVARKHALFLFAKMLVPFLFSMISLVITGVLFFTPEIRNPFNEVLFFLNIFVALGWFLWVALDWSNDFSIISNRRAVTLEKVALFYEKRQEAPLEAILSMEVKTSQLGRLLNYGSIFIRTFTGVLVFKNLTSPDLVVRLINEERNRSKVLSKRMQRNSKEDTIRERLGYGRRKTDPFDEKTEEMDAEMPSTVKPGILTAWLSSIFQLRSEENGIITYHTHWFILLRKIGLPTLVFILLFLSFLLNVARIFTPLTLSQHLLAMIVLSFFVLLWWLYQYWDWRNDRYIVTQDQVIDIFKKPLGQEQKRAAPIKNIQTVEFEQLGIISLLLNYGTVFIRVGDTTFTFDYVYNPSAAQSEIFERYREFNQKQVEKERERMRQEMADWIEIYHQVVQRGGTPPPPPSMDGFSGYNIEK